MTPKRQPQSKFRDYGYTPRAQRRVWLCPNCGELPLGAGEVRWLASDEWLCKHCGAAVERKTIV